MALGWFIAPYKWRSNGPRTFRHCAMDDFTSDIFAEDGDWTEAEIDDDKAIVLVRATNATLNRIALGSDVQFTKIDDPVPYWKPTRISSINGEEYENRDLADMTKYLFDDQAWGNLKALAETVANQSKQGYVKVAKGDWRITAQLLVLLGKAGYGLDKVSTGTFPTVSTVLDNFDRADATTVGAGWTLLYSWTGAGDWGISSNRLYNPDTTTFAAYYFNASTYGPDTEVYVTLVTLPGSISDNCDLFLRAQTPGTNFDAYSVSVSFNSSPFPWTVYEYTDHVGTAIGASATQAVAAGEKIGVEIIGRVITGYIYTGGTWSAVLTRTDTSSPYYDSAGYIGLYLPGINTTHRWDDFSGGTVVAGGGGLVFVGKRRVMRLSR